MIQQHGFLSEEELVEAFADDCTPEEASIALNLFRDLEQVTDLFAPVLIEVEPGVFVRMPRQADNIKWVSH